MVYARIHHGQVGNTMNKNSCLPLDLVTLENALRDDAEFRLQTRYLTTTFRFVIGELQTFSVVICNGAVTKIDNVVTAFDGFQIQFAGNQAQWQALLAPEPEAFFQDFFPAMLHHGFRIEGDMESIMAYYPAIRRMQDLLRQVANPEVAA